jgi:hypothetical protein
MLYDEYAKDQLLNLKDQLRQALGNKEVHEVTKESLGAVVKDLNEISKALYDTLNEMGKKWGGVHVKAIAEYVQQFGVPQSSPTSSPQV